MKKQDFLNLFKGSVEIDPQRRGGEPVIKGTRFPISQLIAQIALDGAVDEFLSEFDYDPETTGKDIELFFQCLCRMFREPPIDKE